MLALPGLSGLAAYLAWKGLKPNRTTNVTTISRLISQAFGTKGVLDQRTATKRLVHLLYFSVAITSVLVFSIPFALDPVDISGTFLHRALLLPLLLGVLVAPFTYISHWSVRWQAPLVLVVVLIIGLATLLFGDTNDVRTMPVSQQANSWEREPLQPALALAHLSSLPQAAPVARLFTSLE